MRRRLALAVLALVVLPAGAALAHGGAEEALEKTPARALAQQALALLSQEGQAGEAKERIEAALKSRDRKGVDLALLRQARRALDRGDHAAARRLVNRALTPQGEQREEEQTGGGQEARPGPEEREPVDRAALEHTAAFEPDRGVAEWIGAALGAGFVLLAGALLLRRRHA